MTRSFRIQGFLAGVCLAAATFSWPLGAEEITVTVPPDSPPAAAAKPATLPSFTGSGLTAQSDTSATSQDGTTTPATTKHKSKKPVTAKAPTGTSDTTTGSTTPVDAAGATTDGPTAAGATKAKTASKASPCKDADEPTCGSNKLCKWVEGTTDAAGKTTKARCRSLAMLKKEAAKKTAAKGGEGDALPWAAKTASPTGAPDAGAAAAATSTDSTGAGTGTATKPAKKTKTASAKKPSKPKAEAPVAPPANDASAAPQTEAPPNADPQ